MGSLTKAFLSRLHKAVDTPEFERKHPFAAGTVPKPRPKPKPKKLVYGGSLGEQERESPVYRMAKRAVRAATKPKPKKPTVGDVLSSKKPGSKTQQIWDSAKRMAPKVAKHKDKRGSTAHHGKGGGRAPRRQLSVPEKHQLRIARQTLRMRPEMVAVMGGPDAEESKKIIERLTGRDA